VRKVGIKYKYENYRIEVRWYRAGVIPCDILVPVKVSIEIVFGSQLTRKDDNVINIF
jgi:hypothetical protein